MAVIGFNSPDAELEMITLEQIKFSIAQAVSDSVRASMRMTTDYDVFCQYVTRHLSWLMPGNQVHEENFEDEVRTYPATMWEELKRDYFPQWLIRRFPVRYSRDVIHRTVKHFHVCPHLNVPDQHSHVKFLITPS